MITELTQQQIARFPEFVDKWLKIGLATDRFTLEDARSICNNLYTQILLKSKPQVIIVMNNPLTVWLAICLLKLKQVWSQVEAQVRAQVWPQVELRVWPQVDSGVWPQVREQVCSLVDSGVWSQVEAQVRARVEAQVEAQVEVQVGAQVEAQVRTPVDLGVWSQVREQVWPQVELLVRVQVRSFIWPYLSGHFRASYFSFYDYIAEVLDINYVDNLYSVLQQTTKLGLIYPFDDVCFVSQKPTIIKMKNKVLHDEHNPAIEYADDFRIWCLNGVRVPSWLVEKRSEEINPLDILGLENAQQRAEGIRKIGIERLWYKCCKKVLDKAEKYELGLLPINGKEVRPYLKMQNPSVPELWHVEGVPIECKTIKQALTWRNQTETKPLILT